MEFDKRKKYSDSHVQISVTFTKSDHKKILELTSSYHYDSAQDYIRVVCLSKKMQPNPKRKHSKDLVLLISHLKKIGNNTNQLATKMNSLAKASKDHEFKEKFELLDSTVLELRVIIKQLQSGD